MLDGAKAMAMTVADLWLDDGAHERRPRPSSPPPWTGSAKAPGGPRSRRSAGPNLRIPSPERPPMTVYVAEEFTPDEADILRRYFTNLDGPVFALVNLPEVVKGALFARYSRSPKSLRRLFLDEFVGDLDITGDATIDATVGLRRAEELYDRVFFEYGDDSVAQLGGVHLACEQASNLLTKVLEWGRLMAYLEQSTRYIAYDTRLGGRYRYYRDPGVLGSTLGTRYVGDMDRLFDTYAELVPLMADFFRERFPKDAGDSDFVYRQAIRAKAFDALRGILPAASLSNVGIYGTGQGYEPLLLRMRAHPLPEARAYADLMLTELRKVIPSFLKRVDLDDRGVAWSTYLGHHARGHGGRRREPVPGRRGRRPGGRAGRSWSTATPTPRSSSSRRCSTRTRTCPRPVLEERVRAMTADERLAVVRAYVGERANRRHKPGRALERPRLPLRRPGRLRRLPRPPAPPHADRSSGSGSRPRHGFTRPEAVDVAGVRRPLRRGHGALGRPARRARGAVPRPGALRRVAGLPGPLRTAAQRPRGHAPPRAAHRARRATRPTAWSARRCTGSSPSRPATTAVAEMMRFVDHSPGAEPRAPRGRAAGRGPPPDALTRFRTRARYPDASARRLTPVLRRPRYAGL